MNRELKEDRIVTYISTLNINLAGNEEATSQTSATSNQELRGSRNSYISADLTKSTESNDVTSVYRKACERSSGTYFQLFSSSHQNEVPTYNGEDSRYQRSKAYFEKLSSEGSSSNYEMDSNKPEVSKTSFNYRAPSESLSSFVEFEEACFSETAANTTHSSLDTSLGNSYEMTSPSFADGEHLSSVSHVNQTQSRSLESTTITSQGTTTSNSVGSTRTSADYYGETDWYMDILLRMQALDMKQQRLMVQYDFLGKLANQNKEDLNKSRDWARYGTHMKKLEVH